MMRAFFAIASTMLQCGVAIAGLKVDLNPDEDRRDILTPRIENWNVHEGVSDNRRFDGVDVTLRATQGHLNGEWWRGGYDTGTTFATDGVTAQPGSDIEIVLENLPAGRHSLTTYHNHLLESKPGRYTILVNGKVVRENVQPTVRVTNDDDAASAWLSFDVEADKDTTITIRPDGTGDNTVTLNGFELDGQDPTRSALKPFPKDGDEHAPTDPELAWQPAKGAKAHQVYVGTSEEAVAAAGKSSKEFAAEVTDAKYVARGLSHMARHYWRVDEVFDDGVVKGRVWRFGVRHLAFPGAEGYGRFAKGGRGGQVIEVTNLNDAGPGSLREAVEAEGPRTVVFRVGGTIKLEKKLVINNPYITIAGQTAPGDGIAVRGYTFGMIGGRDVIVRYMRIRVGDESGMTMDGSGFAASDHAIMDHCSVSWSIDEAVSSRGAKNITLQRCIVTEALNVAGHAKYGAGKGHSFAGSISGDIGSFHHNLVANCSGRNWSLAGGLSRGGKYSGKLDIRNNIVFNWGHRTNDGGAKAVQLVGNLYIPGPATKVWHLLKPDAGGAQDPQQYYLEGNRMEGLPQYDADNWLNGAVSIKPELLQQVKLLKAPFESFVTAHTAQEAYDSVMADVGANIPASDSVDLRALQNTRDRTTTAKGSKTGMAGIIDSQRDVGGWPELEGGDAPADTDHDGMPDWWETKNGLNPADPEDRNGDFNGDGYTNLEKYLNWIVENRGLKPAK